MSPSTIRLIRLVLSALIAGVMGGGTYLLGAISADGQFKSGAWVVAAVMGGLALCKDAQSSLSTPPTTAAPSVPVLPLPLIQPGR